MVSFGQRDKHKYKTNRGLRGLVGLDLLILFSPNFIEENLTNFTCIYLNYATCWFVMHIHYRMIKIIKTSIILHSELMCEIRMLKTYSQQLPSILRNGFKLLTMMTKLCPARTQFPPCSSGTILCGPFPCCTRVGLCDQRKKVKLMVHHTNIRL